MSRVTVTIAATLLAIMPATDALTDEAPPLEHNPFSRPPSERLVVARGPAGPTSDSSVEIDLRATMRGGSSALANVGGRIIRPGDEVDGHLLVEVFEDHAIFQRGSKRLTVYVKPELVKDDEQNDE